MNAGQGRPPGADLGVPAAGWAACRRCCTVKKASLAAWRKWIILGVVAVVLVLWFTLTSGAEHFTEKYAGEDLDAQLRDMVIKRKMS